MRIIKSISLLLCCLLMSGCWDKIEIDRRIFISTIGIDGGKDIRKDKEEKEIQEGESFGEREIEKLKVSFAFPDMSKYSAESKQIPEDKILKVDAYSMEDAMDKASGKSSRTIDIGHSRLLLVSSEVLNYPKVVKEFMDYISRNPKMNRTMYVVAIEGRVEDIFNVPRTMETNIGSYLTGLMLSSSYNAAVLPVTLNEMLIHLYQNGNALVPSVKFDKEKQELRISGVALIKNYALKGFLSPTETANLEMLRGRLKSGKKVIYKDHHPIDFEIDGVRRKITYSEKDKKLIFNINVQLEGKIKGYYQDKNIFSKKEMDEIEGLFNIAIGDEGRKVARLLQREFGVDPIGLNEYLEKFQPDVWRRVKGNWEDAFKSAQINVYVDTQIRRIGVSK